MPYVQGTLISANHAFYPYVRYDLFEQYEYHSGTLAIPVAYTTNQPLMGQRQPQEIVATAAPYSRRIVRFWIVRLGAVPNLPSPVPRSNEVLSDSVVITQAPMLFLDGISKVYPVIGHYIFDNTTPVVPGIDPLLMGTTDADATYPTSNVLPGASFNRTS